MNKKPMMWIAVAVIVAMMLETVSFAAPAVNYDQLVPDVPNMSQKDDGYEQQSRKTVVAFYASSADATSPESFNDIIILDEGDSVKESYTIDISKTQKEYIILMLGGSDGKSATTVIGLPHTEHSWSTQWSSDATHHWHNCTSSSCELSDNTQKDGYEEHIPVTDQTNCSAAIICSTCTYELESEKNLHVFTDAFDADCNNEGCLYGRNPAAVTVTYNATGGTVSQTSAVTGDDGKITTNLPVPVRNGWSFDGWYTAANGGIKIVKSTTVFYESATVYAQWKSLYQGGGSGSSGGGSVGGGVAAPLTYTLNFETNGGTQIDDVKSAKNLTINLGNFVTTKENYEFAGWCSNAELTDVITEVKITGNMTIYAKWNETASDNNEEQNNELEIKQAAFSDVSSEDWFGEAVEFVVEKGIMNGVSETEFAPHNTTTRAMLVTMLYRLDGEPETLAQNEFSDVANDAYYEKAVVWAKENGIVNGYENGSFGTDDAVTREQLAAILYRYAEHKGCEVDYEDTNVLSFDDTLDISEYAYPAFQWACKNGIINGDGNKLMPTGSAERCQVAAMLMRFAHMAEK